MSRFGFYDDEPKDICPKCGKEGCTCGPECECGKNTTPNQSELVQDFE